MGVRDRGTVHAAARVVAPLALLFLVACGGSGAKPSAPATTGRDSTPAAAAPTPLPAGKSDLVLAPGDYASPDGFEPGVRLTVPAGWRSVHRDIDAFDLGRPSPDGDRPDVAVVFLTPSARGGAATVRAVARSHDASARPTTLGGVAALRTSFVGGNGELVSSNAGTISLDAAPGQRVDVIGIDVAGAALTVVVLVPDARRWPALRSAVTALLAGVELG